MPDDLRALLAAIVADPADDTARLVYADCLQEHGNTARADFIRLQIEAERLHPDSTARARLEEKAQSLFAEHWIEWWGEVCIAVGLPRPAPSKSGALGRIARRIGITGPPGHPYLVSQSTTEVRPSDRGVFVRAAGLRRLAYRRGFPDSLIFSYFDRNPETNSLQRWPSIGPLADLCIAAPYTEDWVDGSHLTGLRSLTLDDYDPVLLLAVLESAHLSRLEQLELRVTPQGDLALAFANEFARAVVSPRMRQLKRLSIPLWSDRAAEVVATAENLAALKALEVELHPATVDYDVYHGSQELSAASQRIEMLARSPHLAGLRELTVIGGINDIAIDAAILNPTWTGLRKLDFRVWSWPERRDLLEAADDLPELEELRLSGVSYSVGQVAAFARSPLLKRLRHFAVRGGPYRSVDVDIADAVDPDRIETFAIGEKELQTGVAAQLEKRLGDRFRRIS